ncbi:uncharacterized protein LOC132283117 isoform X1 [Cornus florida]|uniref:uncharacterized protein LOC132283117 isoform X1 n=1 Tax=Cornus florida TaxID=4283 RepID=UPI00289FD49B|nr:uncharacterized protein LOC132283117 isoform X1 [Cornus florida]XP_059640996.1 uncharacterized protein LOC132283117 isoform X1 [Cornus florida]
MKILNLKDSVEKDTFFRKLPNLAEQLPRQIVLKKLLPLLASALEFGSAAAPALNALLKMGSWLPPEEFSTKVYPHVATGFSDTSAFLWELTLKSMLILAPKLSQRTMAGSLLKYLSKLQVKLGLRLPLLFLLPLYFLYGFEQVAYM